MRAWVGGVAGVAALALGVGGGWLLVATPEKTDAPPTPVAAASPTPFGTLVGVVTWGGHPPKREPLPVTRDHAACGAEVPDRSIEVGPDRGLRNALVSVEGLPAEQSAIATPIPFHQVDCLFTNRVTVVPTGATIEFVNGDRILHNTHVNTVRNKPANFAIPAGKRQRYGPMTRETIKITCDIHPWMAAWLIVRDDPYFAVTDARGQYAIHDVPAGRHKVSVWQETVGKGGVEPIEIEIVSGEVVRHDFLVRPASATSVRSK